MLSLPPGYQATQDELLRSLIAARGGEGGQDDIQQGDAGSLQPPPAAAGTSSLQSFRDTLAKIRAEVDDTVLSQPPEPGWFSQMGTAFKETIQDPSSWPTVAKNFGKGAVSGATLGLSELIPEMRPDEESWAGSVGNIAGFIPTAMSGAGLVGKVGAKLGSKVLANTLGKEAVAGAALNVVQPRVENWAKGKEEDRSVIQDAALGAALPAAAGAVGRGLRRLIKGPPPMATLTPDEAIARGTAKSTKTLGASGLTPDVEKQLHDFIKTGKQPLDAVLPRPEQHVPGFVRASQELVEDTAPLAHGTPLVSEMGEELTYLRPGVSTGKSIVKDSKGLTRAIDDTKFQRDPGRLPQPPSAQTAPPAEPPLGGTPGPSPASMPAPDTPPTFWESIKQKTKMFMDSLNLPSRVLGLNPATPEGKLAMAGFNAADAGTKWAQDMEFVYKLKMPRGTKGEKALWEQIGDKKFLINTMLQNQGDEAAAMAALAQHQEGTLMQQFLQNWNKADDMFVKKAVEYGLMKPNPDGSMPRILNHLPFVRYKAIQPADVKVEIGGDMRKVATWAMEHPRAGSFMTKQRKHTEVPDLDLRGIKPEDLVALKIKGMANMFANHEELVLGGLGKNGMRVGPNGAPQYWIDDVLQGIQDPHKREYAVNYVNSIFGHGGGFGSKYLDSGMAAKLRRLQFYHLIAGNMLTPLVNLTQSLVTYSRVSTSNWGKAFYALATDQPMFPMPGSGKKVGARFFAEKVLGASGTFNRVDEEILTAGVLGKIGQVASAPFRWSERVNQKHAAIAGYLEGLSRKLPEPEAIQFGMNLNRMTQQFGGRANTPAAFRGPVGSLLGQFKSFQIGWMGAVKDMVTDAGKGMQMLSAGDPKGLLMAKPLIKYMSAVAALGGPAAVVGRENANQMREQIQATLNAEIPEWTSNGFLGLLGVNLSNQIGMGALPITSNIRDIMWFAPGPLVSHILDGMSVAMFLADSVPGLAVIPRFLRGEGVQLEPTAGARGGINLELSNMGQQMSYDDFMSKMTRSLPLAGPQIEKVRKFIKAKQAGGGEAEAMSLLESLGWELPSGGYTRPAPDQGPLEKALGVPQWVSDLKPLMFTPQDRAEDIERRAEMIETGQDHTSALRTYHSLISSGQSSKAADFARQYYERTRRPLPLSREALKAAWERRVFPATERLQQRAAWPMSAEPPK